MTATTTLHQDLSRAAILLEEVAHELKRSNAIGNRQWVAPPEYKNEVSKDRSDYDEMRRLASVLRAHAGYVKVNPRGGPARVFLAVADRIQAGEDYHEVLADYGLFQTFASKKRWRKSK